MANVAAVIRTPDGETFAAVNVSNDVGGICAEAAALPRVLAESTSPPEIIVAARLGAVVTPCGCCRQLMSDRFPDMAVIPCMEGNLRKVPISTLLPHPGSSPRRAAPEPLGFGRRGARGPALWGRDRHAG